MNLTQIDLNLLKVFSAVWELRSLTLAAERLHLSQPAVSHAMKRLRDIFNDPLFTRGTHAMLPTDAAIRLAAPVCQALALLQGAFQRHLVFDPAVAERRFRIVMSDMSVFFAMPRMVQRLEQVAPSVRIEIVEMPVGALEAALGAGEVDLAFGYFIGLGQDCVRSEVLRDTFVCLLRKGHPYAERALTLEDMQSLRYLRAGGTSTGHRMSEAQFVQAGIQRNIVLSIPQFMIAPKIVGQSDLALIVPRSIAERLNQDGAYVLRELPAAIALPAIPVHVYTHRRFDEDAGIQWLAAEFLQVTHSEARVQG